MRTIMTATPGGAQWRVRVVWQPRWRKLARRFGGWRSARRNGRGGDLGGFDIPTGGGGGGGGDGFLHGLADDIVVAIAVIVCLIVVGALFWWVLLPLLLLVIDMVVVVVLLAVAIPARVLLGRPWTVEAATAAPDDGEDYFVAEVVGWRRALRTRDEIAEKLRLGHPAPVVGTLRHRG
ncbi:hypothetical protein HC031_25280 [Planosporangium thailandense]|uniref:Uncharacterized protein n=1 Tax=Planosporangium thailandense TaxID=765197 RepID=A0ABX0Y3P2_9ACTN|nr:hypothetical protein [Planosporangium thailandense]NJC73004.1 hypothetical protein [Planosporangium thailandense]